MDLEQTSVPLYGEDEETEYIRNILKVKVVAGEMSDPALLNFNYTVVDISPTEIEVKFDWEHPF